MFTIFQVHSISLFLTKKKQIICEILPMKMKESVIVFSQIENCNLFLN